MRNLLIVTLFFLLLPGCGLNKDSLQDKTSWRIDLDPVNQDLDQQADGAEKDEDSAKEEYKFYDSSVEYQATSQRLVRLTKRQIVNELNSILGSDLSVDALGRDPSIGGFRTRADSLGFDDGRDVDNIFQIIDQALPNFNDRREYATFVGCARSNGILCTVEDCACLENYFEKVLTKAYRRPATIDEIKVYTDLNNKILAEAGTSHINAFKYAMTALLSSPEFLFRAELGEATGDSTAKLSAKETLTFASFVASDKGPSVEDLDRADKIVAKKEDFQAYVRNMMNSDEGKRTLKNFIYQWFAVEDVAGLSKNPEIFPEFSTDLAQSMAKEISGFLDLIISKEKVTLEDLLSSNETVIDEVMAEFYKLDNAGKVKMPANRKGLLTTAGFMAAGGTSDSTVPTRRGGFVLSNLLCVSTPGVPAGVALPPPEEGKVQTTRERFEDIANTGPSCKACHTVLDPIGFGFEAFGSDGAYREMQNGLNVRTDAELSVLPATGPIKFNNSMEMVDIIAKSPELTACSVQKAFQFSYGRAPQESDEGILADAYQHYKASGWDLKELFVALLTDARYQDRDSSDAVEFVEEESEEAADEDNENQVTYTNTIKAQMQPCLACHGVNRYPNWGDYNDAKNYPLAGNLASGHKGISWSNAQKAALQAWDDAGRPE